jgi:hypothetical protein
MYNYGKEITMSVFRNLVGKRITGIFLANDAWTVVFRTTDGKYLCYNTENDCCNSVWFNHINGVSIIGKGNSFDLLRGALVLSTEDKGWGENRTGDDGYEVVQDGFWTIRTDRGYIDIEVRNSHNGYYGGSVSEVEITDSVLQDMQHITEDF